MGAEQNPPAADPDGPLTVDEVAALQAGLLDDDTAARVRGRVRADPAAQRVLAALDRVRADVAALGAAPAPEVPPAEAAAVAAIAAGLRSAPPVDRGRPSHSVRPLPRPARIAAAAAGVAAALVAVGVGVAALIDAPEPTPPERMHDITVASPPRPVIPLTESEMLALLDTGPDYGPLTDRLAACLSGLGYPDTTQVLGARPISVRGRPGVLLLLPGERPGVIAARVVAPECTSSDSGLLAETVLNRP